MNFRNHYNGICPNFFKSCTIYRGECFTQTFSGRRPKQESVRFAGAPVFSSSKGEYWKVHDNDYEDEDIDNNDEEDEDKDDDDDVDNKDENGGDFGVLQGVYKYTILHCDDLRKENLKF